MKKIIIGVEISDMRFREVIEKVRGFLFSKKQHYIVTPNPEFIMKAQEDRNFRITLNEADIAIPDGIGIKLAGFLLGQRIRERITGVDLTWRICELARQEGKSVFFLGAPEGVAERAMKKVKEKYKDLKIVSDMGADKYEFGNENQELSMVEKINKAKPDIFFAAFGAPKQEYFIKKYLPKMPSVKVAVGVGGTFDYISGKEKYAPKRVRKIGCEWLYRLITQPWRWKRIYIAVVKFPLLAIKWRFRIWCCYREDVVGFIINKQGKVFIGERVRYFRAWQLPQGGVENNETARHAALREMSEELGADKDLFEVIKVYDDFHKYIWPEKHKHYQGYKGQKQSLAIMRFSGDNKDIDLTKEKELGGYHWVEADKVADLVAPKRKEMALEAVALFKLLKS